MNDTAAGPSPAQILKWRDMAGRANENIQLGRMAIHTGGDVGGQSADDLLFDAQHTTALMRSELAAASRLSAPSTAFSPIPLETLDTPDTRALLDLLEKAQAVAERIDASRGRCLSPDIPLLPGESRGTDLAETISEIALRVRIEVQGPKGRE
jgi:hypothetical protein